MNEREREGLFAGLDHYVDLKHATMHVTADASVSRRENQKNEGSYTTDELSAACASLDFLPPPLDVTETWDPKLFAASGVYVMRIYTYTLQYTRTAHVTAPFCTPTNALVFGFPASM